MINPIIVRKARVQFRLERTGPVVVTATYLMILLLMFFLNYFLGSSYYRSLEESMRYYWCMLLVIQVFVLIVAGGIKVAGSIVRARERKRFDFEIVTGMSPWAIAVGEMAGSALFPCFLVFCTLPFSLLCVLCGGASWGQFGYSYLILFTGGFFFHACVLLVSAVARSSIFSVTVAVTFIAVLSATVLLDHYELAPFARISAVSPFYLPFAVVRSAGLRHVGFFGHPFCELLIVGAGYLFFGIWALNGAARKIENREAPYISRAQAIIFTAIFCLGAAGILSGRSPAPSGDWGTLFFQSTAIYLAGVLVLVLVLAFLLSPSLESYLKGWRLGEKGAEYAIFSENSLFPVNLLILLAISVTFYFAVFAQTAQNAPSLTEGAGSRMPLLDIFVSFFFVLFTALFYSLVIQLGTFLLKRIGRHVAAFVLLLLVLIPVLSEVSSGGSQTDFSHVLNPVTVLFNILPIGHQSAKLSIQALLFYIITSALLGVMLLLLKAKLTQSAPVSTSGDQAAESDA